MMLRYCFGILFIVFPVFTYAQTDSLAVAKAKWDTKKIAPGLKLKHVWLEHSLFNSSQNINILQVKLNRKNRIDLAAEPHMLKTTSEFGRQNKALAAVNGTFFDMKNGGSVDYMRLDSVVAHRNRLERNNKRALHQKAALVIDNNKVRIGAWDGSEDWEDQLQGEDIMVSGPLLVQDKKLLKLDSSQTYLTRHPRTALAVLKRNKVLLITVDGRNDRAAGMSLFEFGKFLKWYQVKHAINLDGGGSTTLWISGEPYGGIINHPSDNKKMEQSSAYKAGMDLDNLPANTKKWDHDGERPVANVILIKRKR